MEMTGVIMLLTGVIHILTKPALTLEVGSGAFSPNTQKVKKQALPAYISILCTQHRLGLGFKVESLGPRKPKP